MTPAPSRLKGRGEAGGHVDRPHMVEKGEGADHAAFGVGQDAAHLEPAEILAALVDYHLNHREPLVLGLEREAASRPNGREARKVYSRS